MIAPETFPGEHWQKEPPPTEHWLLSELAGPCTLTGGGPTAFYPGRQFLSSRMVQCGTPPLLLPEFILMSHNWAPRTPTAAPRRLRNVDLVLDWVPDVAALALPAQGAGLLTTGTAPELSAAQEARLREAFAAFDLDGDGQLSLNVTLTRTLTLTPALTLTLSLAPRGVWELNFLKTDV